MEKSMVHELNGLASSQFFNRSTFITTANNEGDYQLRKSRIQNLPGYRKQDLSNKQSFVIVFQTIQIERLSTEIQALRVALKDAQRQNFNIHNYEVQIRQLTEKCHNYEAEREQYLQEIDRMNMICQKLYEQLEDMKARYADIDPTLKQKYKLERERGRQLEEDLQKWKARYNALETSKNRQMEDMRMMMESQRKSMVDREIKQLTIKFNSQRQNLEKQIRKLRQYASAKDMDIERANTKAAKLQILNQQMRHYEETINEYENKFAMISQQTIRLNQLLRTKHQQIQKLNGRDANSKRRISELQRLLQQQKEGGEKARQLQTHIRQWQTKYSRLQDEKKRNDLELQKIPEFQSIIHQINRETEKLKDTVKQKMHDIDQWRYKYDKLMGQFKQNKSKQQSQIPMLENKLNQVNNENNRINDILKNRTGELQSWKNKYTDIERQITRYVNIEQQKRDLGEKLDSQIRHNSEIQRKYKDLEGRVRHLDSVQGQLQNQKRAKQQCIREIQRLNEGIKSLTMKIDEYQRKCDNLERKLQTYIKIQEQIQIYKQKQINLTRQIDRINGILNQKIRQVQQLKTTFQKIQAAMGQYQGLQQKLMSTVTQMQKLMGQLDESRKEAGFYQQKFINAEGEVKRTKNQIYILSQEKQQAVKILNAKSRQLDNLLSESDQLRGQINVLKQKEARGRQIQEKYRASEIKISQMQKRISLEQRKANQLNMSLQKATEELNKIKREGMMSQKFKQQFMQLKLFSQQKERQVRNLQMRINQMENIVKRLKESTVRNDQIIKRNHQKWMGVQKQLDLAFKIMQKMLDMQNEITKLNEQNMKLESKVRLMKIEVDAENMKKSNYGSISKIDSETQFSKLTTKKSESFGSADGYSGLNTNYTKSTFQIDRTVLSPLAFKQNRDFI